MGQIIGASHAMQGVYKHIRRAASTDISVMLMGETGTGKDLVAQAIHRLSKRNEGPYVPVNLGALPRELVASELFGHEKGSFTGATRQHHGKFEQAKNGTLFLDEIESIDEKVQISLLRILEEKRFTRLGGAQPIRSNARLIVATNDDLEELVQRGVFRKDLFYRLDVFRISLPPLSKRYGDIPLLVSNFIAQFSTELGLAVKGISSDVLQSLEAYEWPGNIRELKNVIHRAVLMCEGNTIEIEHLPGRFKKQIKKKPTIEFDIGTSLEEVERSMILRALELSENNRKAAAELLGISRRAIYNKLKKHDIE
jgi:DNA-binding NtrC family response regulator